MEMEQSTSDFFKIASIVYSDPEYGSPWQAQFIQRCNVTDRTFRRWCSGSPLPGPVRAMILAHEKCHRYGIEF
jgi:hypothetical protein